jgi:DNA-binding Lrp family transcriptional regulator
MEGAGLGKEVHVPSKRAAKNANARAYVLIETETGYIDSAVAALRAIPEIVIADAIIGPCDIILMIETPDQRDIGRLVIDQIHAIPGIKRTTTCFAIQ